MEASKKMTEQPAREVDIREAGRGVKRKRRRHTFSNLQTISLCLLALSSGRPIDSLQISSIEVPAAVINGSQVSLVCNYDLQGDQLYSVKWYKDYVEFFRFQPQEANSPALAKQEFELSGINLNLAKSNGTHVLLEQTRLASEGTYKCEVSADSPSFATLSLERQMKIYDNAPASTQQEVPQSTSGALQTVRQQASQPLYSINDVLNLTCLSGGSRPAAKLSWLLNERPVPASWLSGASATPVEGQLIESRLTLSFRIQPEHLAWGLTTSGAGSSRHLEHLHQRPAGQPLRLRCLAKLSLEFATQTSILVSGGKAKLPKGERPGAKSSSAQALVSAGSPSAHNETERRLSAAEELLSLPADVSIYRWPRPTSPPAGSQRLPASSRRSSQDPPSGSGLDPWPSSSGGLHADQGEASKPARYRTWSQRQLRQQAEHIEQLLRALRPNELDSPTIEATLVEAVELEPPGEEGGSSAPEAMPAPEESEFDRPRAGHSPEMTSEKSKSDYQLNDLVKFTCRARLRRGQPLEAAWAPLPAARSSLVSSWLLNGDQLALGRINAFNGSSNKFYFLADRRRLPPEPALPAASPSESGSVELLIEFTQSLFQAKELSLECRSVLEQPLVEYESQLVALVAAGQLVSSAPAGQSRASSRPKGKQQNARFYSSQGANNLRNRSLQQQQQAGQSSSAPESARLSGWLTWRLQTLSLLLLLLVSSLLDSFPVRHIAQARARPRAIAQNSLAR